jgi:hypothetical protein
VAGAPYQTDPPPGQSYVPVTVNIASRPKYACGYQSHGEPYGESGFSLERVRSPAWAVVGQGYILRQPRTAGDWRWSAGFELGAALDIKGVNLHASFNGAAQTGYDSNALMYFKFPRHGGFLCGADGSEATAAILVQRANRAP